MSASFSSKRWIISESTEQDKPKVKALFNEVFGHPMSEALWQWKYGDGRGVAVVAKRSEEVIAHYGGVVRRVYWRGKCHQSIQCVDTMVKPAERGTLARRGPYFLVARAFLERYVGYNRPYEFGYGFPNKRVMRLGERVGIQASVGNVVEPVWSPLLEATLTADEYDPDKLEHVSLADSHYRLMRQAMADSIVGVRDAAYLKHRYLSNPTHRYAIHLVKQPQTNKVLGLVVYRADGDRILLLDVIGEPGHFGALIDHVRQCCGLGGSRAVVAWFTEAHLEILGGHWERVEDPQVRIPTSVCTDGPSVESLTNKWFLTAGDTDFK